MKTESGIEGKTFHVQTVNPVTGKIYWTKPVHSTIAGAMCYAKRRCKDQRRILIWEDVGDEIYLRAYMNDQYSRLQYIMRDGDDG